jgi:hypothetical protein
MAIGMGEVPSKPKTDKPLFSLLGQEQFLLVLIWHSVLFELLCPFPRSIRTRNRCPCSRL